MIPPHNFLVEVIVITILGVMGAISALFPPDTPLHGG